VLCYSFFVFKYPLQKTLPDQNVIEFREQRITHVDFCKRIYYIITKMLSEMKINLKNHQRFFRVYSIVWYFKRIYFFLIIVRILFSKMHVILYAIFFFITIKYVILMAIFFKQIPRLCWIFGVCAVVDTILELSEF